MAERTVTRKRDVCGGIGDFFFFLVLSFLGEVLLMLDSPACDVFQSGGQQAARTLRVHLRDKT